MHAGAAVADALADAVDALLQRRPTPHAHDTSQWAALQSLAALGGSRAAEDLTGVESTFWLRLENASKRSWAVAHARRAAPTRLARRRRAASPTPPIPQLSPHTAKAHSRRRRPLRGRFGPALRSASTTSPVSVRAELLELRARPPVAPLTPEGILGRLAQARDAVLALTSPRSRGVAEQVPDVRALPQGHPLLLRQNSPTLFPSFDDAVSMPDGQFLPTSGEWVPNAELRLVDIEEAAEAELRPRPSGSIGRLAGPSASAATIAIEKWGELMAPEQLPAPPPPPSEPATAVGAAAGFGDGETLSSTTAAGALSAAPEAAAAAASAAVTASASSSASVASAELVGTKPPILQQVGVGLAAGGVSGIASRAVVHPFDTLRVLQSVSSSAPSAQIISEGSAEVPVLQRLSAAGSSYMQSATQALSSGRKILGTAARNWHLSAEANPAYDVQQLLASVRILYRGYGVSVLGAQPVYAVYFGAYEATTRGVQQAMPEQLKTSAAVPIFAGFLAECAAVSVWNPWEVVRQRMQIATTAPRSFVETAREVVAESGVRGLYTGGTAYLALWGAFSPLMFVLYERGMAVFARPRPPSAADGGGAQPPAVPSLGTSFVVGSLSGMVASAITSPLDVVKTRMQTQTPASLTRYDNVYQGLREIAANEGPRALFRGTIARALNMGLMTGIMLGTYGVMRATAMQRMGYLPADEPAAPTSRRVRNPRGLQEWVTPDWPTDETTSYTSTVAAPPDVWADAPAKEPPVGFIRFGVPLVDPGFTGGLWGSASAAGGESGAGGAGGAGGGPRASGGGQ